MASQQQMRRDNKTVDQGDVPQVTHYESLTVVDSGAQPALVHRVVDTMQLGTQDQTQTAATKSSQSVKENRNAASRISGQVEGVGAKSNVGVTDTVMDVGKKGADVAMETAKTTVEYAGKAAGAAKDAAVGITGTVMDVGKKGVVAGANKTLETGKATAEYAGKGAVMAAGLAYEAEEGVRESMEGLNAGVATAVEGTAVAAEKGAGYIGQTLGVGKDVTLQTGRTAADYARNAAGTAKDAVFAGGRRAAEFAGDTTVGVRESMESLNAGVGGVIEETAAVTEMVGEKVVGATSAVVDLGKKGAVAGKDITLNTGKATAGYVSKAGRSAAEMASGAAAGLTASMESLNAGVGELVEGAALATEKVAQTAFDTVVGVGKKGASYGKDVTVEGGKATAQYVGKAAEMAKDVTLAGGWGAVELASDTAAGVTESMESLNRGVAGLVEGTALATEEVAQRTFDTVVDVSRKGVDMGKKGASYIGEKGVAGKDITMETGKTTAEYVGKAAGVLKDAALVAGWSAAELASDTAEGVTDSMESLNAGVAGLVEGTALATEGVAQNTFDTGKDIGKTSAEYVGKAANVAKNTNVAAGRGAANIALETGKTGAEYVGKAVDMTAGAALAAGRGAANIALETGKTTADFVGKGVDVAKDAAAAAGRGAAAAAGRGAADIAFETGKTTAEYVGKGLDVAKGAAQSTGRGAAEYARDKRAGSKESSTVGNVGVGTQPKTVVVEREEITVDYGRRRNNEKETKKGYKG